MENHGYYQLFDYQHLKRKNIIFCVQQKKETMQVWYDMMLSTFLLTFAIVQEHSVDKIQSFQ